MQRLALRLSLYKKCKSWKISIYLHGKVLYVGFCQISHASLLEDNVLGAYNYTCFWWTWTPLKLSNPSGPRPLKSRASDIHENYSRSTLLTGVLSMVLAIYTKILYPCLNNFYRFRFCSDSFCGIYFLNRCGVYYRLHRLDRLGLRPFAVTALIDMQASECIQLILSLFS